MENRKIIHVDMDAFYASVEQLDFPELRGKALAVGGNEQRGVISAASYEARKFGVKSAMSSKIAKQLCPELIFARPRFDRYKEISNDIHEIFKRYTDLIEPLSLDEAFLDVTSNKVNMPSATYIAQAIKNDIRNELNLIASAGVSYNKFLAKIASDQDKPDGLFVIEPKDALDFLSKLPIQRFFGIGKVTADRFMELGVFSGKQLRQLSLEFLQTHFGKSGAYYYQIVRGIDNRSVHNSRERKSIAVENTFFKDIYDKTSVHEQAKKIAANLWTRYEKNTGRAKTLTLKLKYTDFTLSSKSQTYPNPFTGEAELMAACEHLIDLVLPLKKPIRLLGFQLSGFVKDQEEIKTKPEIAKQSKFEF